MRTIKFASKVKKVKIENKIEKREFFYAIVNNHDKYIGFYLEDVPMDLMQKAKTIQVEKDIYDDNDEFVETVLVNVKIGQLDFFNHKGITYIRPNGRYHYLGNSLVNKEQLKDMKTFWGAKRGEEKFEQQFQQKEVKL